VAYARAAAIGLLESPRYFGPIRAPVAGTLREINETAVATPRTMTDARYTDGWFARLHPTNPGDRHTLKTLPDARDLLADQIRALRIRCFAAFPDREMFEIGLECSAVLAKLNELLLQIPVGEVVHLVTDDPTAPIEMVRWSDQTGQPVIDERKEGNLFHFLVRKIS
jgi:glycine cleavage system H protein